MSRWLLVICVAFVVPFVRAQNPGSPTIASLSNSQTITEGRSVTLSVSVNGTAPFTYQWRKGSSPIAGATASTLVFDPIRAADAGSYDVVVTNASGNVTSGPVILAVNPATAPSFYYQPSAVTFTVGETINVYASVNGTEPMSFVWKKGGTVVATTSSNYYSKANASTADAGSYTVTVTNVAGSATSNAFTISIVAVTAPRISGLYNTTIATGDSFYFYPSVSGTGTITYQWKKDGVVIPGATSYYFSKYGVTTADAGSYTLTATNSAGSTTSDPAVVTVLPPVAPKITSISSSTSVPVGGSFSLSVYASGTEPLTYQWRKDGVAISGATSNYYSKSNVTTADAGAYTAVVTNAQGSATSSDVTVSITNAQPPLITYQPASFAVREGEYISSISVGASGTGTLSYQWRKDGVAISGATGSSYYFGHVAGSGDAGAYTVVVSSTQGSVTSDPCNVVILPAAPPVIVRDLASQTVRQGQSVSFYPYVTASPAPTFVWRKDGAAIAGASYSSYSKSNLASSDAGVYSFVATNTGGSATSNGATVTVLAATAPQITSHPASASLLPGDYFSGLYINVQGDQSYTVQWYRDGLAVFGATSTYYSIGNAQPSQAGTYYAVVTNAAGSATSREAVITVDANTTRPVITYVPGGRAVTGGSSVSLSIATSGSGETLQWFKDGVLIPNATSKEYYFNNFGLSSVGTYTAQVTNGTGTYTSRPIVLELLSAGAAPQILTQPAGMQLSIGGTADFSVYAEGEAPLTYQWRKDGVNITGANSSGYSLYNVTAAHAGAYSVVVTNSNGSVTSAAAALSVPATATTAPIITYHPASRTLTTGSSYLDLGVSVLDSTGCTYQWRKNGVAIAGATSRYYTIYSITAATAGRYSVVVTNTAGSATSYDAVITVTSLATGPTFTTQPQSQTAYYGNTVTFTAAASSTSTITYQWRRNGAAIAGATNSTLTLSNVQSGDAGTYTLLATDVNGSTPSSGATLTLSGGVAPFIISAPSAYTAMAGSSATFVVAAGGTPAPTFQWQRNGSDLAGATNSLLSIAAVQATDAGNYTVVVRNPLGSVTTAAALLTVLYPPPTITTQPMSQSALVGGTVSFSVGASALPVPTYQWRKDGVNIAGATNSALVLTNVQTSAAGRYSVVVRTDFGSVTSAEALLTVGNPIRVVAPTNISVYVGDTATLTATVESVDPLVLRWYKNGTTPVPGATSATLTLPNAQLADAGSYVLVITRPDGTVLYPASGSGALAASITVLPRPAPIFIVQPQGVTTAIGGNVTLLARAIGTGTVRYQWKKNGAAISGATGETLVFPSIQFSDSGDYASVATDANGSTTSNTARVIVTGSPFTGSYAGTLASGEPWALQVEPDGSAVFLTFLSGRAQAIVAHGFTIDANGRFTFGRAANIQAAGGTEWGARFYTGEVSGQISINGGVYSLTGQISAVATALTGARVTGSGEAKTGMFQAVPVASGLGEIDAIALPDGSIVLVAIDTTAVRGGRGQFDNSGAFTITQPTYAFHGAIAASSISGVYIPAGGTPVGFATAASAASAERLINVATRGLAGTGSRVLTAGFVIGGDTAKEVLIRAVGPGLGAFGVPGTLVNPRLRLYKGSTAMLENDDWWLGGFATQIADAGVRVGAFKLTVGSADAAILTKLDPGPYTAQITGEGESTGVALVEVYDAAPGPSGSPKLINLSTRGDVGTGGDILIAGIVVNGSAAKKLLIRGIGPTLGGFGLSGTLSDPKLELYQGTTLVRANDNWDSADASSLADAATAVGAFALPAGSKDAALLLYLAPGSYTAQVSGVAGATGVALVEVYEVP